MHSRKLTRTSPYCNGYVNLDLVSFLLARLVACLGGFVGRIEAGELFALLDFRHDPGLEALLLGRGVPVPIVVVFLGTIGGFMTMGTIGLFVGAIVLSVGYKLFLAWLEGTVEIVPDTPAGARFPARTTVAG